MSVSKRLSQVLSSAKILYFDDNSRFVLMSDCHRGDGTWSDNFLKNQNLFFAALTYYYENNYTYIELGDGDELWENRKLNQIVSVHSDSFWLMSQFYKENRLYMLYGNHDMAKKYSKYLSYHCSSYFNETEQMECYLFPDIEVHEGIILKNYRKNYQIFLVHGHQGDLLNDTLWRLSRFLVRFLWRRLELIGFQDPTSSAKNYSKKHKTELRMMHWVDKNNQMLIAGHTHRPAFPQVGETLYFNDGSCVHPRCITAIEIWNGSIALVKWAVKTREDRTLYVDKEVLEGPVLLKDYFENLN
ncbi:calcineurin-like phosphoesterase family protein [Mobilisporobacter senegalensis]|uniref:Calcineurin-like phosphoesterase family protein n=1 Tax=Mobilisporobacter senegalensis TaxID=1329262 RepID=A0A3N1XM44_9FIRM|nr:metallophosphoesterase [Mobilisporobacter senegalensis]ROR27211.1 calcineurin-like phosphoesterase family protein [Mobilisporobacter senegalensis]